MPAKSKEKSDKPQPEAPGDFDQKMESLEEVVRKLESGDLPLEKAFDLFQQGMTLHAECAQRLERMEKKIETLIKNAQGEPAKKPVDDDEE